MKQLLTDLNACQESIDWIGERTIEQAIADCHRGDWILWLAQALDIDKSKLTLAKGLCANTVRHLMKDERSIKAVDAAIAYGNGEIDDVEIYTAYIAAYAAYTDARTAVAVDAATPAAYAAVATAAFYGAAYADAAAYAATAAFYAAADDTYNAKKQNQMHTANICREILGELIIEKVKQK